LEWKGRRETPEILALCPGSPRRSESHREILAAILARIDAAAAAECDGGGAVTNAALRAASAEEPGLS
jgi:hypothetical protein